MSLVEVEPSLRVLAPISLDSAALLCEYAGRTCYRSTDKIKPGSADPFLRRIIKSGHDTVIQNVNMSVEIVCTRVCSHQILTYRMAVRNQESQRRVVPERFEYIDPWSVRGVPKPSGYGDTLHLLGQAFDHYRWLIACGEKPEVARHFLPPCAATRLVWTQNLAQWRHVIKQRTTKNTEAEFRGLMLTLLEWFRERAPWLVFDLEG